MGRKIFSNFHCLKKWPPIYLLFSSQELIGEYVPLTWGSKPRKRKQQSPEKKGRHCKGSYQDYGCVPDLAAHLHWSRTKELNWHLQDRFSEALENLMKVFARSIWIFAKLEIRSNIFTREKNHMKHQCNCSIFGNKWYFHSHSIVNSNYWLSQTIVI